MKAITAVAALIVLGTAACTDDYDDGFDNDRVAVETAPSADDDANDAVAEVDNDTETDDAVTDAPLDPDTRTSEETVSPESETLFY